MRKGILDLWWNSQSEGDIDEHDVGFVKIYPTEFEELKGHIASEIGMKINYWNYFIKENNITKPSVRYSRVIIIIQDLQQLKEKLIGKYGKEDGGKQK